MKEQLIQYVELLFAGAQDSEEIKLEILQNTLDRYDDLIAEGKVPEAAYRLAITGIGDVNEILGMKPQPSPAHHAVSGQAGRSDNDIPMKKRLRAIAVGLYIASMIPLFAFSELGMSTLGLCCMLCIVSVATVLIMLTSKKEPLTEIPKKELTARKELDKSIGSLIGFIALVVYLIVSFLTKAWFITWVIFPIMAAIRGLVNAILDLKEAIHHEN